jgi:hypothetical protein
VGRKCVEQPPGHQKEYTRGNRKYPEISREKQIERKKESTLHRQKHDKKHTKATPKAKKKKKNNHLSKMLLVSKKMSSSATTTLSSLDGRTDSSIIARRRHIGSLPAAAEFVEPVGRETTPSPTPGPSSPPSLLTLASI